MKSPKKTSAKRITIETPKTDNLVYKVQSEQLPYIDAFYQLLELTRAMESEVIRLKNLNKHKNRCLAQERKMKTTKITKRQGNSILKGKLGV
ncbi:MAG: hypothetical protein WCS43_08140 [Verrucomicrobiota bacterium]